MTLQKLFCQGHGDSTTAKHSSVPKGVGCQAQVSFLTAQLSSAASLFTTGQVRGSGDAEKDSSLCLLWNNTKNVLSGSPKGKSPSVKQLQSREVPEHHSLPLTTSSGQPLQPPRPRIPWSERIQSPEEWLTLYYLNPLLTRARFSATINWELTHWTHSRQVNLNQLKVV